MVYVQHHIGIMGKICNVHIFVSYHINIRKSFPDEAFGAIPNWLDRFSSLMRLDFNPNYTIKYNVSTAMMNGYLPIRFGKLKIENRYLYNVLAKP